MQSRILVILKRLLMIWGGVSLLAVIGIAAFLAFQISYGNREKIDSASIHDVRFVLNWCGLGESRIESVLHSYVSSRSFTGDYIDAYAIRISRLDMNELTATSNPPPGRWYRGDQLPPVLNDAVAFVGAWLGNKGVSWFPKEAQLRSAEFYVYPWRIISYGVEPGAVELIFVRPSDKMVFYFGAKT